MAAWSPSDVSTAATGRGARPGSPASAATNPIAGPNANGRATRELLIRTAERLCAEKGLAVPLREISKAANQRNNVAVQYHFGDRSRLIAAVQVYRSEGLNRRRLELLGELEATDGLDDVGRLLRAAIQPHVESLAEPDNHFVALLARIQVETGTLKTGIVPELDDKRTAHLRLRHHLARQVPHLSQEEFDDRYSVIFAWAIQRIATYGHHYDADADLPPDDLLDDLTRMLVSAPCVEAPARPAPPGE